MKKITPQRIKNVKLPTNRIATFPFSKLIVKGLMDSTVVTSAATDLSKLPNVETAVDTDEPPPSSSSSANLLLEAPGSLDSENTSDS
jgi:hypothetical protein